MNKIDEARLKFTSAPAARVALFFCPARDGIQGVELADHIKRWFCPTTYAVPEAVVEMRVGGRFEVYMRSPEGVDHWTKGTFTEVIAPERLTIDHHAIDPCGGGPLFSAVTAVKFIDKVGR